MKNLELLSEWLSNPKRKYTDGLTIFELFATEQMKRKYGQFLKENKDIKGQFSPQMGILTNCIARIQNMMRVSPDTFKEKELIFVTDNKEIDAQISEKNELIKELQTKLQDIEDQNDYRFEQLEEQIAQVNDEVKELEKQRIVKVVPFDQLPAKLQKVFRRNKEITPLMASLHAQISEERNSVEDRQKMIHNLIKLDDERRKNWDLLDDYQYGKLPEEVLAEKAENRYSESAVIAGSQMQKRIGRLKQNILRTQKTIETADRELIKENAQKRLADYTAELKELEKKIRKK